MDFRHLIVTCLFSKLRLPFDNQKVKENYAIFIKKVGTFVVKGPYLSVCMCLCMLEYMLMKPGTYAYGAGNTCKCSLIYLAGESVRADLLY